MNVDLDNDFEDEASAPRKSFRAPLEFKKARGSAQMSLSQFTDICKMSWADPGISNLLEQLLVLYKLKGGTEISQSWDDPERPK